MVPAERWPEVRTGNEFKDFLETGNNSFPVISQFTDWLWSGCQAVLVGLVNGEEIKNCLLIWTSSIIKRLHLASNQIFKKWYIFQISLKSILKLRYHKMTSLWRNNFCLHLFRDSFFFFFVFSSLASSSSEEEDDELDLSSRISSVVTTTTEGTSGTAGASLTKIIGN